MGNGSAVFSLVAAVCEYLGKRFLIVDFNEMLCHGVEAETVEWPEVDVGFHGCKDKGNV